jgi:hypothetical protein
LYTKQHGVESNLFLAPGEGDKVRESVTPAQPSALPEPEETISNAVRLLGGGMDNDGGPLWRRILYSPPAGAITRIASTRLERVYTRQHGKNKNRAEQFYGDPVVLGMALHHRVSTPDFLERCARDSIVAVLSWDVGQFAAALIRIGHFMNGIMAPGWQG